MNTEKAVKAMHTPEAKEKRQRSMDRYRKRKFLKEDIFFDLAKDGGIAKGVKKVLEKANDGEVKPFVDLVKMLAPKEVDITSGGEKLAMPVIEVDGKALDFKTGEECNNKEEEEE